MSKITLNTVGSISQNPTSAATAINANNAIIQAAIDNTLSRDGTAPNQMAANLDMESNRIINLPSGVGNTEPVTVGVFNAAVIGKGNVPLGGSTNQVLAKNSATDYDTKWINESSDLAAGSNISITGTSPATINTTQNPNFTTSVTTPTLVLNGTTISGISGTGNLAATTSPTFVTPILGTPTSGVATNLTGTAAGLTAGNVTTNANLTGDVTSVGNATTLTNAPVIAKVLTGYTSGAGTVSATDSILQAIQKLNGNDSTNANLTGAVTSVGNATSLGSFTSANLSGALTDETGSGAAVFANTPTLVTPVLGAATGTSLNLSGLTISSAVATDGSKNLVSVTNTGSGNNVLATSPTLVTPALGTPTSGSLASCTGYTVANIADVAWATYTPTVTSQAGSFTTVSATGRSKTIGKTVVAQMDVTITAAGTASGYMQVTLPFTAASNKYVGTAFEAASTGKSGAAVIVPSTSTGAVLARFADGTTVITTGNEIAITITYEIP